jgi:hypothetical protein
MVGKCTAKGYQVIFLLMLCFFEQVFEFAPFVA